MVGGSGFIGTRLIGVLADSAHDIVNYDLRPSAAYPSLSLIGDIRDTDALASACASCDVVVNLAAEHRDDVRPSSLYASVNVDGARSLTQAAARQSVRRVVFTSSVSVYGLDQPHPNEESTPAPFNEYGRSKLEAESVLGTWADADPSRSLVVVRPCVVFGEDNRGNVYNLARQIASGHFLPVGDGSNRKSMAYVGNIANYLATTIGARPGRHLVNYADKPDLTTRELVTIVTDNLPLTPRRTVTVPVPLALAAGHGFDALARLTGRSFPISAVRVRKFLAETTIDTTRLEGSGFLPSYTLTDGLRRTLAAEFPDLAAGPAPRLSRPGALRDEET